MLLLVASALSGGTPAIAPDRRNVVAPDRVFDMQALALDLTVDPTSRTIAGTATWTVNRLGPGELVLDGVALRIASVTVDGVAAAFRITGPAIHIPVPDGLRDQSMTVILHYSATPRSGLHFRAPPMDRYAEVFSQGEANDNRYWFPGWDHPNDRFAYTGTFHVPEGWTVITNSGTDLANYLVMVAAGPYEATPAPGAIVHAAPGGRTDGVTRDLPAMFAHFAERTGVPFPWGTYRQVFVQRFLYAGMENTSATVEAEWLLYGPDATRSIAIERIVSHELAHQWFGDLLTCRDWRELWLNEGFAEFMEADWHATHRGAWFYANGMRSRFRGSLEAESLAARYFLPDAATSHNVYAKGASVLHMLRTLLGEDTFWRGIRRYVADNAHKTVDTDDLRSAMEVVSGRELGWFFQQWVELPTVPALTVTSRVKDGWTTVTVRQTLDDSHPPYALPVEVEVGTEMGPRTVTAWLEGEDVEVSVEGIATYVAFDPRSGVLASVVHEQDPAMWEAQLRSEQPFAVLAAIDALAETDHSAALLPLALAGPIDLRLAVIRALGKQRVPATLVLLAADPDARVREAAITALGEGVSTAAMPTIQERFSRDPNIDVRAAALGAMARLAPAQAVLAARSRLVPGSLGDDWLAARAADALGDHGTLADLTVLLTLNGPGRLRLARVRAASRIAGRMDVGSARDAAKSRVARAAEPLLTDLDQRGREGAVGVLSAAGDDRSIPVLESFRREETIAELASAALTAIQHIRAKQTPSATPNELAAKVEALEKRLTELEAAQKERR